MPKSTLFFVFAFSFQTLFGEGLKIITSGGLQGVVDSKGHVLIPAIYEKLGWSDGSRNIIGESVGFYENGKWGLLNVTGKSITQALYATMKPLNGGIFEAGIRSIDSNRVNRGLIDAKGKVLLDFKYFTIEKSKRHHFIVSEYQNGRIRYGVISDKYEEILPIEYLSIERLGTFFLAQNSIRKIRVFDLKGIPLLSFWVDQVEATTQGLVITNEGYKGLMDKDGQLIHDVIYKSVRLASPEKFALWEVRKIGSADKQLISCDSIGYNQNDDLLIAHVNHSEHLLAASNLLFKNQQHALKHIKNGFLVTQNNALQTWGIYKTDGREIAVGFDSVAVDTMYYYGHTQKGWEIYNLFGRKINEYPFQAAAHSQERMIPAKRNDYWGWIDFQGERIVDFRFDRIVPTHNSEQFMANNYGKWGVSTFDDEWLIKSEYDSMYAFQNFYVGMKGQASYLFTTRGERIQAIPFTIVIDDFLKIIDRERVGAITKSGHYIDPQYHEVKLHGGGYYELIYPDGSHGMVDANGRVIIKKEDGIQEVLSFSEDYFHIIKDDKHGFVDTNGKLRVANRYDSAQYFNEGLAPIKLMGRWGYIDHSELLTIQPYYKYSSVFKNGLAIIQVGDNYGIIDKEGEEIVDVKWKHIDRLSTGNYLITDWDSKVGLVDVNGYFMLRPNYNVLEDTPEQLIVATLSGNKGVLDYKGLTKVPFEYKEIEIKGDYLLLLKE